MINKNQKTKYLVIGYGKFGNGFITRLVDEGIKKNDIYITDLSDEVISNLSSRGFNNLIKSKIVDLKQLENFIPLDDIDIILIGTSNLEISMSIAYSWANNPEFSKKEIFVKASNDLHRKLLKTVGINSNNIVIPEEEVGSKTALKSFFSASTNIEDISKDFSIVHLFVENKKLNDVSINELGQLWKDAHESRNWNIIIILDINGQTKMAQPDQKIFVGDRLSIGCLKSDIKKLYSFMIKSK